jgi:hypothetical protein
MFIQIILTLKEYSKIACKNCLKILDYSTIISNSSITNMLKHCKITTCKKRKQFNFFSQLKLAFNCVNLI